MTPTQERDPTQIADTVLTCSACGFTHYDANYHRCVECGERL